MLQTDSRLFACLLSDKAALRLHKRKQGNPELRHVAPDVLPIPALENRPYWFAVAAVHPLVAGKSHARFARENAGSQAPAEHSLGGPSGLI